jgi:hypothetical protein
METDYDETTLHSKNTKKSKVSFKTTDSELTIQTVETMKTKIGDLEKELKKEREEKKMLLSEFERERLAFSIEMNDRKKENEERKKENEERKRENEERKKENEELQRTNQKLMEMLLDYGKKVETVMEDNKKLRTLWMRPVEEKATTAEEHDTQMEEDHDERAQLPNDRWNQQKKRNINTPTKSNVYNKAAPSPRKKKEKKENNGQERNRYGVLDERMEEEGAIQSTDSPNEE